MGAARRFAGKRVWITGASSGIGAALAEAFAAEGATVLLSARREAELTAVAARCGERARVLPLDLAATDTHPAKVAAALDALGGVDVLVHNGGISQRAPAAETALAVDRRIMEVNYFGAVSLTKALLPTLRTARAGHFVVISSVMGKIGTPHRSAYAASKHALHGFFDCLRAEVADEGIAVTMICPGYIRTEVSKNALRGDGTANAVEGEDIAKGHPADATAAQILDAIAARKSEVYVGALGKEPLALFLKRFFPSALERLVRRATPS